MRILPVNSTHKEPIRPEDYEELADALSARTETLLEDGVIESIWLEVHIVPTVGDALADVWDELVVAHAGRGRRTSEALMIRQSRFSKDTFDTRYYQIHV